MTTCALRLAQADPSTAERPSIDPHLAKFVTAYCLDCHQGQEAEGGAALDALLENTTTEVDRKLWSAVAKNVEFLRMPPEEADQPGDDEREEIVRLIRALVDNVDCSGPANPGVVTLRRLTRYEYRRTVKDLLGYDYEGVDEFPSDDVGHGFDNIGDVLTLSPLHYEKYLIAAEAIAAAVVGVADGDFKFRLNGAETDAVLGSHIEGDARVLSSGADLKVPLMVPANGRYEFTVRLAPEQAGPNWVQAALLIDNRVSESIELKQPTGTESNHRFASRLTAGKHELVVRYKNDYFQPAAVDPNDRDRNLIVREIKIDGPYESTSRRTDEWTRLVTGQEGQLVNLSEFATRLFSRAYRRTVTPAEVKTLTALMASVEGSINEQLKMGVKAALVSPNFLYRVESSGDSTEPAQLRRLNDFDIASRLSYFLWSSMPDDWLLEEAAAGRLQTDEQIRVAAGKMLADRRSTALIVNFVDQWLQLRRLDALTKDKKLYPGFDPALVDSMRIETQMFVASIFRAPRSVLDVLDSNYTYIDRRLAKLYGLSIGDSNTFKRVSLEPAERGGVLTQAAILATTARPTRTSPVMRGKWILETILGDPPPPPAPGVDQLDEAKIDSEATLREMLEAHRADKSCAACHEKMDALGFALEEFDAIGARRSKDSAGNSLDTRAEFPDGTVVENAAELRHLLRTEYDDAFVRCLTEKLFTYAVGRQVESFDECTMRSIVKQTRKDGDRFASIVEGIVLSDAFRLVGWHSGGPLRPLRTNDVDLDDRASNVPANESNDSARPRDVQETPESPVLVDPQ